MHIVAIHNQQQTTALSPGHLLGKSVLKMCLHDLQQFVATEFMENPALDLEEGCACPICGCILIGDSCRNCGASQVSDEVNDATYHDEWQDGPRVAYEHSFQDGNEPFLKVAAPKSLYNYLNEQVNLVFYGEDRRIADFIVGCLDEDGYLREPLFDIASIFNISVPQLESVLLVVQSIGPPGVGARDIRECLDIQLNCIQDDSTEKLLAESIIRDHWDDFQAMKLSRIAKHLKVSVDSVEKAVLYIRLNLNPHPADAFRDPWENLIPRKVSMRSPDVIVRDIDGELVAEIVDPVAGSVAIDDMYAQMYAELSRKAGCMSDEERVHVKEWVGKAKSLIEALDYRRTTIHRIMDELISYQADFFVHGPCALKPMNKKELAGSIGVHESTVCRATQGKTIQILTGEVIMLDVLFDSALPTKELVRKLASRRLTDSQISAALAQSGVHIARRTVAKYRDQLRLPALGMRFTQT